MGCNNSKSTDVKAAADAPESKDLETEQEKENENSQLKLKNEAERQSSYSGRSAQDNEELIKKTEMKMYVSGLSAFARTTMMVAKMCDGINIEYVQIDLEKQEQMEEWFLKINPKHTVPVLVHGNMTLTESVDISKYLIYNFGQQKCKH